MWSGTLGTIKATQHRIDLTPGANPVYQPPYRAGPAARVTEKTEVQRMLQAGVIEPSMAEWASPVVLVPKPDGSKRFCIDYRRLNAITIRDSYPIPRMDECIDSLGEASVFTTLDANSGYWQVEIAPGDRDKTTFTCHEGLYRFIRMPFGLKNAPATFQRAIDIILSKVKWQYALVYLDDVIIYSKSVEDHFAHVRTVLTLLQNAGVSLKLNKCSFFTTAVDYLGHKIRPGKLEVASRTCEAIRYAKPPTNQTEIRSFLGLCNVYRRFVKNFARIAAPLNKKLHKDKPKYFGPLDEEELQAFATLRNCLLSPPILALPKMGKPYIVETDACNEQVGCVLLQEQETAKDYRPIGYWSRTLTAAERNYTTSERECLAIVWAILMLRPYLEGTKFTVRTDHDSLRWLLNISDVSGRLARWRLRLAEFDYTVVHRPGVKHQAPDALSRLPTAGADTSPLEDGIPCFTVTTDSGNEDGETNLSWMKTDMTEDDTLTEREVDAYYRHLDVLMTQEEELSTSPISMDDLLKEQASDAYCQSLVLETTKVDSDFVVDTHGLICRRSNLDGALQRVVPESLRKRVLYLAHYPRLAGHPGGYKLYATLRREYYWPFMANDAYQLVKDCQSCTEVRGTTRKHLRKLSLFPATGPLEFVAMDYLGPLPRTPQGNQYVLVITDRFSKLARALPMKTMKAEPTARAFLESWAYVYGPPQHLLTDNGSNFTSKFFQSICLAIGSKNLFTTAYHPQTNGQAERYNRTLVTRLRHFVAEHQRNWDEFVQPLTYAYNMQVHASTGTTPFDLILSRHPPSIISKVPAPDKSDKPGKATAVTAKRANFRRWRTVLAQAREKLSRAQRRYKANFDARVSQQPQFRPGQYIVLDNPPLMAQILRNEDGEVKEYNKLQKPTSPPYPILAVRANTLVVEIDGIPITVSIDRCSLFPTTTPPIKAQTQNQPADATTASDVDSDEEHANDFIVDKIVDASKAGSEWSYRIRWYGFPPNEDTWEPSQHIPDHFITAYWKRQEAKTRPRSGRS